jgi:hypothetical protein
MRTNKNKNKDKFLILLQELKKKKLATFLHYKVGKWRKKAG